MTGSGSALQITRAAQDQDQDQDQDYANRRGAKRGNRRIPENMRRKRKERATRRLGTRESRELHWFQLLRPWRQSRAQLGISQAAPPSTVL